MTDLQHKDLPQAQLHEPKQIKGAGTADSGKAITPSESTAGVGTLRFLASSEITYDPTASGLSATTAKAALDEIVATYSQAANISYDNTTSNLTADDVQAALDEIVAASQVAYGSQTITNNATATSVPAAADSTFNTVGDYVQLTGIFDSPIIGPTKNVTLNTNDVKVDVTGVYKIGFWATFESDTNSIIAAINFGLNGTVEVDRNITTRLPNNTDPVSNSAEGILSLSAGDLISFWIAASGAADITLTNGRFHLELLEPA